MYFLIGALIGIVWALFGVGTAFLFANHDGKLKGGTLFGCLLTGPFGFAVVGIISLLDSLEKYTVWKKNK